MVPFSPRSLVWKHDSFPLVEGLVEEGLLVGKGPPERPEGGSTRLRVRGDLPRFSWRVPLVAFLNAQSLSCKKTQCLIGLQQTSKDRLR